MQVLSDPFGATRPVFLLPDRHRALQLIDHELTGGKRIVAVRSRNSDHDRWFTDNKRSGSMNGSDPQDRPLLERLGHNFANLVDHDTLVCLIFEVRNALTTMGMIPNGSREQDGCTGRSIGDEVQDCDGIDRFSSHINVDRLLRS